MLKLWCTSKACFEISAAIRRLSTSVRTSSFEEQRLLPGGGSNDIIGWSFYCYYELMYHLYRDLLGGSQDRVTTVLLLKQLMLLQYQTYYNCGYYMDYHCSHTTLSTDDSIALMHSIKCSSSEYEG